jgi:hypothetical protein
VSFGFVAGDTSRWSLFKSNTRKKVLRCLGLITKSKIKFNQIMTVFLVLTIQARRAQPSHLLGDRITYLGDLSSLEDILHSGYLNYTGESFRGGLFLSFTSGWGIF